ncbi:MAG: hypothetical protein WCJ61_13415, partial [Paludibacter sp.]
MKLNKLFLSLSAIAMFFSSCAYDDSYLDAKLTKNMVYFASLKDYTRTVVVGEGLQFRIGAAMAGMLHNDLDRTVNFKLGTTAFALTDTSHVIMPINYYNYASLLGTDGTVKAIIPQESFIGFFSIVLDSVKFLNDPLALKGKLSIPVKIWATSLDSINKVNDSVTIKVKYMAGTEGYYLYKNTISKELNGVTVGSTVVENYANESNDQAWSMLTQAPFTVLVTAPIAEYTTSMKLTGSSVSTPLKFNITVNSSGISYQQISGQAAVLADGANTYDKKT